MRPHGSSARGGVSVPEALVALLLGFFVVHFAFDTLARVTSVQARLAARSDGLVALRVARYVLRRELRHGRPGRDWSFVDDSLSVRAFRGTALVCPSDSAATELVVAYRGDRGADPTKDSVLLFTAAGESVVRALVSAGSAPPPCAVGPVGSLATWRLDDDAPAKIVLARLFERGSYHLSGSALRYRRGLSGRQPLTPEVWSGATRWTRSGSRLGVDLLPRDADGGRPWSGFLAWMDGG